MHWTKRRITSVVILMVCINTIMAAAQIGAKEKSVGENPPASAKPDGKEQLLPQLPDALPAPAMPPLVMPMAVVPKSLLRISFLDDERVRSELKFGKDQRAKIAKIRRDIRAKHKDELERAGFSEGEIPPPTTARKSYEIKQRIDAEEEDALVKALPGILTNDQMKRLRQISLQAWQASGVNIFITPEVVKSLKLTKEQRQQIIAIEKEMKAEVERTMRRSSTIGRIPAGADIEVGAFLKIAEAARGKVMANVLSDEQRKIWKEMLGKPCDSKWWKCGDTPRNYHLTNKWCQLNGT